MTSSCSCRSTVPASRPRSCARSAMRAATPPCRRPARSRARGRRARYRCSSERLATGPLALYRAYDDLDVVEVHIDPQLVADVDTPADSPGCPARSTAPRRVVARHPPVRQDHASRGHDPWSDQVTRLERTCFATGSESHGEAPSSRTGCSALAVGSPLDRLLCAARRGGANAARRDRSSRRAGRRSRSRS